MKRSSVLASVGIFLALAFAGGGLYLLKFRSGPPGGGPGGGYEPAEAVQIVEAQQVPWQRTADLVGTVLALRSVAITNELGGVIRSVNFQSGDIVEEGQVLVTQDDSTDRAELATAEARVRVATANVHVADARVALANAEAARIRELAKSDVEAPKE